MNRPKITKFTQPSHINDYPVGPSYKAGHLVTENASWRTERPVLAEEKCIGCYQCYLLCPEGVLFKKDKVVDIDFAFCKGCGICAKICPKKAFTMVKEGEKNGD